MTKRQVNSVRKVIEHTRNAIKQGGGYYMPSDAQTEALNALYHLTADKLGVRNSSRFKAYLDSIDAANCNLVYTVCADEKQLAAVEKALAALQSA